MKTARLDATHRFALFSLVLFTSVSAANTARAGNLFVVTGFGSTEIRQFSSSGKDLGAFATNGQDFPEGVAFDHAGNLYLAINSDSDIH